MTQQEIQELTDEELLNEKRKRRNTKIINATLIGFCVGIVIWSVAKNTWGFITLIPLFFIYKLVNNSNNDKGLEDLLKKRNLDE